MPRVDVPFRTTKPVYRKSYNDRERKATQGM